jgi:phospholipid/cholesterol/gamma-HCH transport system substrate-binding protein
MASYSRGRDALMVAALAVCAAVAFSLLFLYMTNRGLALRRADVHVRFAAAEGLRKGDPVVFRGVQVGEVRRLNFSSDGDVIVSARLLDPVPLTRAARAELVAIDLFGRQSLVLRDGITPAPRFVSGDTLRGTLPPSLTGRMSELGDRAARVVGDTMVDAMHHALDGIGAASHQFAALGARIETMLSAQEESLALLMRHTAQLAGNVETITDPSAVVAIRDDLARTTASLARATAQLDTTGVAAAQLLRNLNEGEGSAGMLLRDPALYQRTNQLLASLEELIVDVRSNPKKYINVKVF